MEMTKHETSLCLIKQHKNRGRYELYIHAEALRTFVKSQEFEVLSEDLSTRVRLKKKMLFKSMKYGVLLSKILDRISSEHSKGNAEVEKIQGVIDGFNEGLEKALKTVNRSNYGSENEFFEACYENAINADGA